MISHTIQPPNIILIGSDVIERFESIFSGSESASFVFRLREYCTTDTKTNQYLVYYIPGKSIFVPYV